MSLTALQLSRVVLALALLGAIASQNQADAQSRTTSRVDQRGEWVVTAVTDNFVGKTDCMLTSAQYDWISAYRDEVTLSFLVAKPRRVDARIDGRAAQYVPVSNDGRVAYIREVDFARDKKIAVRVTSRDEPELMLSVDLTGIAAAWRRAGEAPCPKHLPKP